MIGSIGIPELVIVCALALLVFGPTKQHRLLRGIPHKKFRSNLRKMCGGPALGRTELSAGTERHHPALQIQAEGREEARKVAEKVAGRSFSDFSAAIAHFAGDSDAAAPTLLRENDKAPALYVLMPMRV